MAASRQRLVLWAYAGLCIMSGLCVLFYLPSPQGQRYYDQAISDRIARMTAIRAFLPRAERFGYLSPGSPIRKETTVRAENPAALRTEWEYNAIAYALAPALLLNSTKPRWVIADFPIPENATSRHRRSPRSDYAAARQAARRWGLRIVRDYGNGLFLLGNGP